LLRIANVIAFSCSINARSEMYGAKLPQILAYNDMLSTSFWNAMSAEDRLVLTGGSCYDTGDSCDDASRDGRCDVFLPSCFPSRTANWSFGSGSHSAEWEAIDPDQPWPTAAVTRAVAWAQILDCGDDELNVPRKLEDAWDQAKRSREYLNASEHDCNAKFYAHAMLSAA